MKKVIIIVLILIGISMSACVSTTEEPTTEIPTTTEDPTTEEPINTSFVPVDSATLENDLAILSIEIDTTTIDNSQPVITVVVKVTAKIAIDQELGTSSYGDEGIIGIRIVSIDNEEISLFSEFYDIPFTTDLYNVHLDENDILTRSMQFARMPFHSGYGGELPSPIGIYKVQVALYSYEIVWIDTGLFIEVS